MWMRLLHVWLGLFALLPLAAGAQSSASSCFALLLLVDFVLVAVSSAEATVLQVVELFFLTAVLPCARLFEVETGTQSSAASAASAILALSFAEALPRTLASSSALAEAAFDGRFVAVSASAVLPWTTGVPTVFAGAGTARAGWAGALAAASCGRS